MRAPVSLLVMALLPALAGCGGLGFGSATQDRGPTAPVARVETSALPPLPGPPSAPASTAPISAAPAGGGPGSPAPPPLASAPETPAVPAGRGGAAGTLAGEWNALDRNGTSVCRITLQPQSVASPPPAMPQACVSQDLFRVAAWQSRGEDILLLGANGAPIVLLRPTGAGRYEGETGSGERVALWR